MNRKSPSKKTDPRSTREEFLQRFILDTSVFTNPEVYSAFGKNPTESLKKFLDMAGKARGAEFFMPPSIYKELTHFIEPSAIPAKLQIIIQRKAPKKYEMTVPAFLLYELIDDVRKRVDKGLRVAEEMVEKVRKDPHPEDMTRLRRKYREALREGIIDSKEDVELVLLGLELNGVIVTADKGIMTWAEKLGIRWIEAERLKDTVEALINKG